MSGLRRLLLLASLLAAAATVPASAAHGEPSVSCPGKSRWNVKTLADREASLVSFSPKSTTVEKLVADKTRPKKVGHSSTRFTLKRDNTRVETTTYRIQAELIEARHIAGKASDGDQDIHLVVANRREAPRETMVVEFPHPDCVPKNADSRKKKQMADARAAFEKACERPPKSGFRLYDKGSATVTGVGFWDVRHGKPKGAAPNYIELHPVLGFRMAKGSTCVPDGLEKPRLQPRGGALSTQLVPDVGGVPALDVAIGLAFMFFLLSTVCSALNEAIASILGWRAKTLEDAIRNLLGDRRGPVSWGEKLSDALRGAFGRRQKQEDTTAPAPRSTVPSDLTSALFGHWRITALVRDPDSRRRRRSRPSYLPAGAFSLALAETLARGAPSTPEGESPWALEDKQVLRRVETALGDIPATERPMLQHAAKNSYDELEKFRTHVETAFNDVMERASGWYKRKVQIAIAVIAAALAIGLNVDTVHVAARLWQDPALRADLVARASAQSQQGTGQSGGQAQQPSPAQRAADEVQKVNELALPLGWGAGNAPKGFGGVLRRIPGWIVTIAALTLGAPFWFDVLSRFARLRGTGVPTTSRSLSDQEGSPEARPEGPA